MLYFGYLHNDAGKYFNIVDQITIFYPEISVTA